MDKNIRGIPNKAWNYDYKTKKKQNYFLSNKNIRH